MSACPVCGQPGFGAGACEACGFELIGGASIDVDPELMSALEAAEQSEPLRAGAVRPVLGAPVAAREAPPKALLRCGRCQTLQSRPGQRRCEGCGAILVARPRRRDDDDSSPRICRSCGTPDRSGRALCMSCGGRF